MIERRRLYLSRDMLLLPLPPPGELPGEIFIEIFIPSIWAPVPAFAVLAAAFLRAVAPGTLNLRCWPEMSAVISRSPLLRA